MKKKIKVNFEGFYKGFDKNNNIYVNSLKDKYDFEISKNPDFLFYSCYNDKFKKYKNCVKIFHSIENVVPNFNQCDYSICFNDIDFDGRNLKELYYMPKSVQNRSHINESYLNRRFCNFVYSNNNRGEGALLRIDFCKKLSKYKRIDCPGRVLNNMANDEVSKKYSWSDTKTKFLEKYKFTIAFENTSSNGYITEKLIQPLISNSIPIYWGAENVGDYFNKNAFINVSDYKNFDEVIEKIIELDNNDKKYLEMLLQKPMTDDYDFNYNQKFIDFLVKIIENGNKPFYKSKIIWGENPSPVSITDKGIFKSVNLFGFRFKIN